MPSILRAQPTTVTDFDAQGSDALFVRAAARAMQVLSAFHQAAGPLSLSEIAANAGLDRSASQRIVHTLVTLGYLRRSADNRGYLPGLRIFDNTLDLLRLDPLVQKATPVLLELRKTVRERVDLSLFDETRVIYALRLQSKRETFYATLVGHSVPSFCTAGGRAALSALPDDKVREIITRTPRENFTSKTVTDIDQLMQIIAQVRSDGFCLLWDEFVPGEVVIGVAVGPHGQPPLGAIHVAGSLSEWTPERFRDTVAPLTMEAARAINDSL
ncbi:IclR family transcriptional regulator [Paracoccus homiensis]|uniref:DNA-binding transcriptional regulator, IclR family n=1 Tax=Paracoccus homiensis TaxID=364199 RepID=A0A1I0J9G7_9RHOB|nr:IclR family transcriptional regulator [Paracoccus homiensis]SEU06577.1 DNA-binding transcriptional regulator, IclR family [Paracoccus homiensis]